MIVTFLPGFFKRAVAFGFLLLVAQSAQAADDPLKLFKNYFLTGDVASAGISQPIRGTGNSTTNLSAVTDIRIPWCDPNDKVRLSCVPQGADTEILAAFLYWETLEKTAKPSGDKGYLIDPGVGVPPPNPDPRGTGTLSYPATIFGKPLGNDHAAPCWSSGGSTCSSHGAPTLRVYREDVARFLKLDATTRQRIPFVRVRLADSGSNGNTVPLT